MRNTIQKANSIHRRIAMVAGNSTKLVHLEFLLKKQRKWLKLKTSTCKKA
jgi:hypothetical protein